MDIDKNTIELTLQLIETIKSSYLSGYQQKIDNSNTIHKNYNLKQLSDKYQLSEKQYNKLRNIAKKEQWRIQRQLVERKLRLADDVTLGSLLKESTNIDRKTLCKITEIDELLNQYIQQNSYSEQIDIKGLKIAVDCIKELHNISKDIISTTTKDKELAEEYNKRKYSYQKDTTDIKNEIDKLTQEKYQLEKLIQEDTEDITQYEENVLSSLLQED